MCAAASCGPGELCKYSYSGAPDGGVATSCFAVPSGCRVFDCMGKDCPVCIAETCAYYSVLADLIRIDGRTLTCPGE
jgi:hypothetical protein